MLPWQPTLKTFSFFQKGKIRFLNEEITLMFFSSHQCFFIDLDYFLYNFGAFLTFWGNPEIQDSVFKMAAI